MRDGINIRIDDDTKAEWQRRAREAGLSLTDWIKSQCARSGEAVPRSPVKARKPSATAIASPTKPVAASGIQFKDLCPRCINKIRPIPIGIAHLIERAEVGIHASIVAMAEANELLRLHVRHKAD